MNSVMPALERVPGWLWWGSWLLLAAVLIACLGGAVLLWLGAADVPPVGSLFWEAAAAGDCLAVDDFVLPALPEAVTVELSAAVDSPSSELVTWGVWLASRDGGPRWEVLPPGYYRTAGQTCSFPHVGEGANILRLDVVDGAARLWLNREFAQERRLQSGVVDWGLLGDDAVCWQRIAVYAAD